MSPSQLEGASRKGKKKALLIAVKHVKGIDDSIPQANRDAQELKGFLISQSFLLYPQSCNPTYTL